MSGTPVHYNTIIASTDSVACDSVGVRIVGQESYKVDYLRWLYEIGLGAIDDYQIVGNSIEPLKEIFANA